MSATDGMDRGPSPGPVSAGSSSAPPPSALPAVSGTAISVAGVRAWESARDGALFDDPFAGVVRQPAGAAA
jgi:hypothetical protein